MKSLELKPRRQAQRPALLILVLRFSPRPVLRTTAISLARPALSPRTRHGWTSSWRTATGAGMVVQGALPLPLRVHLSKLIHARQCGKLVALSYCISWLGAYTSTQIVIHAKYSRKPLFRWIWTFLASIAFGFTAIWSMHFGAYPVSPSRVAET